MAPEAEISQLIGRASTSMDFKRKLLDRKTRKDTLIEARYDIHPAGDFKEVLFPGIPLTDDEIEALDKIEATKLPKFAEVCSNYTKLMEENK